MRLDCPRQKTGDERHSNRVPTLACQANIPFFCLKIETARQLA